MERRELRNIQTIHLDISEYDAWRDFLHAGAFSSSHRFEQPFQQATARYAWEIGQKTVFGLRERGNTGGSEPRVLCGDEYSDAEVLVQFAPDKRREMFVEALRETLLPSRTEPHILWNDHVGVNRTHKNIDAFLIAGICMGRVLLGIEKEESRAMVLSQIASVNVVSKRLASLLRLQTHSILPKGKEIDKEIGLLLQAFAEGQETGDVGSQILSGGLDRGIIDAVRPGVEIVLGDGDTVMLAGSDYGPYELDEESSDIIIPLIRAVYRGRADMVEQAKELAYQYLGVMRPLHGEDDRRQPPEHWTSERIIPLRSDEILVWVPSGVSTSHMTHSENSKAVIIDLLLELAHDDSGWYLLRVTKGEPIAIAMTTRLTS